MWSSVLQRWFQRTLLSSRKIRTTANSHKKLSVWSQLSTCRRHAIGRSLLCPLRRDQNHGDQSNFFPHAFFSARVVLNLTCILNAHKRTVPKRLAHRFLRVCRLSCTNALKPAVHLVVYVRDNTGTMNKKSCNNAHRRDRQIGTHKKIFSSSQ